MNTSDTGEITEEGGIRKHRQRLHVLSRTLIKQIKHSFENMPQNSLRAVYGYFQTLPMKEGGGEGRIKLDKLRPLLYGSVNPVEEIEAGNERAELHTSVRTPC